MEKPKKNRGFGAWETLGFLAILGALTAYTIPTIGKIREEEKKASAAHATCMLETAKNQFGLDAKTKEKTEFDGAGDAERYSLLENNLGMAPDAFQKSYGLTRIKINALGTDVEVE